MTVLKMNFTVEEHRETPVAQRFGPGFYYAFDDSDLKTGPFESLEAAHQAAVKLIEHSVAAALSAALFGEAA
ncbi:hypothetical protein EVB78_116 [Rhizobium phage RHph_N1_15]|nr:hypothetical protein EVB77_116 [Rhizobium phage RHph_N1_10]QIG69318.1 hypothetical protein EVB78_116 [Rhizobium phage RHph_N1_15]QIG75178.1 hypothetical protein EVC15_116 [Rhizobium phage RHph_N2_6]